MDANIPPGEWEGLYLACLQESALGMVVLDSTLSILFWNRWMVRASGYTAEAVVGRNLLELCPDLTGSRLLESLQTAIAEGLPAILSHKLNPTPLPLFPPSTQPGAGARMDQMITVNALPLRGRRCILMQVQDVTGAVSRERQLRLQTRNLEIQEGKLRESEELFRGIIETAPVGLAIFGCEGHRGVLCNTRMGEMLRLESGVPFTDIELESLLADPVQTTRFMEIMRLHGLVREMELRFVSRSQRPFWGLVSARRIQMVGGASILLGVVDISQRKEMEEKLFTATREAQQASRAKSHFLANMSHEIRTPLNAVIGLSSLALERCDEVVLREYLEKISFAGRSLLGLLNNLLDFSKIEAGKLDLEKIPFLLDDVLNNVGGMFCALAAEKGLEIFLYREAGVPNALMGDPLRLGQVLINLVNNAIKFTQKGEVVVSVERSPPEEPQPDSGVLLRFSVKDSGVGMLPDQMERIFESFEQGDGSITRRYGGSGLGLAICRRLVGLMGADIRVHSVVNEGSMFYFDISLPAQAEGQGMERVEGAGGKEAPVLLVGNNISSLTVASHHLRLLEFQPVGPVKEPPMPSEIPPGLAAVILDWRDREEIGRFIAETLQVVRERAPGAKVVLLVPFGRDDLRRGCHQNGGEVECLAKPLQFKRLRTVLLERRESSNSGTLREDARQKLRGAHVLLVEDSIINQQVAVEMLEHAGMRVSVAKHGREALEMLPKLRVDAVLMDVQMPVMNGFEATLAMRADRRFATLPVIAMTASALTSDRERCLRSGMVDFVPKPIEPRDLYAVLLKWITLPLLSEPPQERGEPVEEEEENPPLPDYLPGIDLASVMERMEGNTGLFRRILELFVQKHADAPRLIHAAVERGEWEEVRRMAHTIKGSAGSLSATALSASAQVLEMSVRRNEREAIPVVLNALETALGTVLKAHEIVQSFRGGAGGGEGEERVMDLERAMEELARLEEHLESNNLDALQCLSPLKKLLRGNAVVVRELTPLERRVGALEFEAALEQVRQIRAMLLAG